MPLLDIERAIRSENVGSRFRLVNIAGQRARELNSPKEDTMPRQSMEYTKYTTTALDEIIEDKISFKDEREDQ